MITKYGLKLLLENNVLQIHNVHNFKMKNYQYKVQNNVYQTVTKQKIININKNKCVKHLVLMIMQYHKMMFIYVIINVLSMFKIIINIVLKSAHQQKIINILKLQINKELNVYNHVHQQINIYQQIMITNVYKTVETMFGN